MLRNKNSMRNLEELIKEFPNKDTNLIKNENEEYIVKETVEINEIDKEII